MTDEFRSPAPQSRPATLSDAELRATLYFAVGVTSESGYAAYQLAVAGDRASTPALEPADNSGYTIGTLQTDLGQHYQPDARGGENVPRDLVSAYQTWARLTHADWVLTETQEQQTISDLGRDGNAIRSQQGRPIDATIKSHIDSFLSTDDGISWVHARDVAQVDKLMNRVIAPLQRSDVYRNASADDQVRLAVIVGKAFNQNEARSTSFIQAIERNEYQSVAQVSAAVNDLSPRRTDDYFEQGRDKALLGANVLNSLRNSGADNPLSSTWRNVLANPLVNPALLSQEQAHPNLASEYPTIKGLFLHYDQAQKFAESLERGGTYQNASVDKRHASQFSGAGFYASGNDFVTWNRNGEGHAYIGGAWNEVDRNDLSRMRNADQTTDLNITRNGTIERLLHIDPSRPILRPVQQPAESVVPMPSRAAGPIASFQARAEPAPIPAHLHDFRHTDHPRHEPYERFMTGLENAQAGFLQGSNLGRYTPEQHERIAAALTAAQGTEPYFKEVGNIVEKDGALWASNRPVNMDDKPRWLKIDLADTLAQTPETQAARWRDRHVSAPTPGETQAQVVGQTQAQAQALDPQALQPTDLRHPGHPQQAMFTEVRSALSNEYDRWGITRDPVQLDRETGQITLAAYENRISRVGQIQLVFPAGGAQDQPTVLLTEKSMSAFPNRVEVAGEQLAQAPSIDQTNMQMQQAMLTLTETFRQEQAQRQEREMSQGQGRSV